jgi:hypothetical protein
MHELQAIREANEGEELASPAPGAGNGSEVLVPALRAARWAKPSAAPVRIRRAVLGNGAPGISNLHAPGGISKIGSGTTSASGTFLFSTPSNACLGASRIKKVNSHATLMALVPSTGTRAVVAVNTTAGSAYTGLPL